MKNLSARALFCLSLSTSAGAVTREQATLRSRTLMQALLTGNPAAASELTASDVTPWIAMLDEGFPKSDPGQIRYEIMDAAGSDNRRRCVVRVERGLVKKLYYVEFDELAIVGFRNIRDLASAYREKLNAQSETLFRMIAYGSFDNPATVEAVVRASGEYVSLADELRKELQWYKNWLRSHDRGTE